MFDTQKKEVYPEINVKNLKENGFYVELENFDVGIESAVKCLLMDAILSMIAGAKSLPKEEINSLLPLIEEEPGAFRPFFPTTARTSLEMAGFINGYCIRFADLCDTRRQNVGRGGHPADMIAALIAMCDKPGAQGKNMLEAINLGYRLWAFFQNSMMCKRTDLDGTTALALTIPVIAGAMMGYSGEKLQNVLNVSAMGGPIVVEVRSSKTVTNCKSGASGYAIARAFWCYRMSSFLQGTPTMFTGAKGWSKMVAPIDGEFQSPSDDEVYGQIQFKAFPCCNANQVATEAATYIHGKITDKLGHIAKIHICVCEKDSTLAIRPGSLKYPNDHPSADHHIQFCTAIGLKYGTLAPKHYDQEYLQNEDIHHLIDITEVTVLPEEQRLSMGGENGAGILEVTMDDGTCYTEALTRPCGLYTGFDSTLRAKKMEETVKAKRRMIEEGYGLNLSEVEQIVGSLEKYSCKTLLDAISKALNT